MTDVRWAKDQLRWAGDGGDAAVVARVAAAIAQPGPVTLCLPGGSTPRPIFAALAALRLPWDKVTILPGDERQVPHDHVASNVGALRAAFGATGATIEPLSAPPTVVPLSAPPTVVPLSAPPTVVPLSAPPTVVPLSATLPLPRFTLVWLGVGDDGHVASLFPGNDPDPAAPAEVIAVTPDPLPPEAPFPRLTLTLAALANADDVIVVARGAAKRRVLEAALAGADLPVARLFGMVPVTMYWAAG